VSLVNLHILSLLIFFPLLGALAVAFLPSSRKPQSSWTWGLIVSGLEFLFSLHLPWHSGSGEGLKFAERYEWIPSWGISFLVGIDGFSLYLILLTTFLVPIIFLMSRRSVSTSPRAFVVSFLILETGIVGSLASLDLFLFYLFWEVMLIPMFLIIGIWGGENKVYAAVKFLVYTMLGSVLMLVAILWLTVRHGQFAGNFTFALPELCNTPLPLTEQLWLFAAFGLAFAIKIPAFPFHTWLPDAHTEAPTGGSVVLASVLLKLGGYGFLRFALPLFPDAAQVFAPVLMLSGVVGILYGALVSRVQDDLKRLIAFSSVSHLGFVVLGLGTLTVSGLQGAVFVMLSHGLTTGALFLLVGMLHERRHTRMIDQFGGLQAVIPNYSLVLRVVTLASIGLPGLSGFVGEFLVLLGASQCPGWGRPAMCAAAIGMVGSAFYMLHMFQAVMQGPIRHPKNRALKDLDRVEMGVMAPILVLILVLGLFPNSILARLEPLAQRIVETVVGDKEYELEAVNAAGVVVSRTPVHTAEPVPILR